MINGITTNASVYSFPNSSHIPGSGKSLLTNEQIKQLVKKEIPELRQKNLPTIWRSVNRLILLTERYI